MKTFLPLLLLIFLVGCGDEEILHYKMPKEKKAEPAASAPALPTQANSNAGFDWEAPEGWTFEPGSGMRFATFKLVADGKPAECTLVKLGGSAGGLAPNINRWRGQIGLASSTEEEIKASLQNIDGKIGALQMSELINPEDPEKAILATIINGDDYTLFVKIMATKKQVEEAKADFIKFSASISLAK